MSSGRDRSVAIATVVLAGFLAACFPRGPGDRLQQFADVAPQPGQIAPTFELVGLDGHAVSLAEIIGEHPVVLQIGSHTCPVFRARRHWMRGLWDEYAGRVDFYIVYTQEAHPVGVPSPYTEDEWVPIHNKVVGIDFGQPTTYEARVAQAAESRDRLELEPPVLVDGMDNAVWSAYGQAPSPAFVIAPSGEIELAQVWVEPKAIRATLDRLLADDG